MQRLLNFVFNRHYKHMEKRGVWMLHHDLKTPIIYAVISIVRRKKNIKGLAATQVSK